MIFNSYAFALFLPIVFILYWFVFRTVKKQNLLLLFSSYFFYGWWDWRFLFLILFSSLVDYVLSHKIEKSTCNKQRDLFLLISLISNLGLLAFFKYFNFFTDSFSFLMRSLGWEVDSLTLDIILPVGISFYTFQTLSYTIDVYRKKINASKDIISFFTFVSFFPQLVAGPIERASNLLPQINKERKFSNILFKEGIFQIAMGFFRKMVIADNLGKYVDLIYTNTEIYNSSSLLLASIFYAFQIYYDFSGYSDIAIGVAKLFGFTFNKNFNLPYFSKSITEFWRKWHISLSFWLRDYLYISLGGNRKGIKITYRNLMITMLLGGLWHGSSWNFIIWGGIHGVVLCLEKYIFKIFQTKNFGYVGMIFTFFITVLAWVFFRASSFDDSIMILSEIFSFNFGKPYIGDINIVITSLMMLTIGLLFDIFLKIKNVSLEDLGNRLNTVKLVVSLTLIILLIVLFYSTSINFIYFQF